MKYIFFKFRDLLILIWNLRKICYQFKIYVITGELVTLYKNFYNLECNKNIPKISIDISINWPSSWSFLIPLNNKAREGGIPLLGLETN